MKLLLLCSMLLAGVSAATAQTPACDHTTGYCEIREVIVPADGALAAETAVGAITAHGWDKDYVLARAVVTVTGEDEPFGPAVAALVQVNIATGRVWASGPTGRSWAVAYEIFVPQKFDLRLTTHVGAISIDGVAGVISAETHVGAIALTGLAGDVQAATHVGAITAELTGDGWEGRGLTASTKTGSIRIVAKAGYGAHFDLRTNLGRISAGFPGARPIADGLLSRKLVFDSGPGGAPVRAMTSVGSIELQAR